MYYSTDFSVCISIALRNNVCGAREFSVNFCNSFREFSVKLGIFSETSREITHFSPWIRSVPNYSIAYTWPTVIKMPLHKNATKNKIISRWPACRHTRTDRCKTYCLWRQAAEAHEQILTNKSTTTVFVTSLTTMVIRMSLVILHKCWVSASKGTSAVVMCAR